MKAAADTSFQFFYKEKKMNAEIIRERLEQYLECEKKILSGAASYRIGDRELRRADLAEIRAAIDDLSAELKALELKHGRRRRVVFI